MQGCKVKPAESRKAPVKAGKELGVEVPCEVKVSNQPWAPSHASAPRQGGGEAFDRGPADMAIELQNRIL
jgi:hypothetical protein